MATLVFRLMSDRARIAKALESANVVCPVKSQSVRDDDKCFLSLALSLSQVLSSLPLN